MGIFQATRRLEERLDLADHDRELIAGELAWFNENLPVPPRRVFQGGRAICWFHAGAHACIRRLWAVAAVLRLNGVGVELIRTADPGRPRYKDDLQVVAVPWPSARPSSRRGGSRGGFLFFPSSGNQWPRRRSAACPTNRPRRPPRSPRPSPLRRPPPSRPAP
jgi:hypothetical protein